MDLILDIEGKGIPEKLQKQYIFFPERWKDVEEDCYHKIAEYLYLAQLGNDEARKSIVDAIIVSGIEGIEFENINIGIDDYTYGYIVPAMMWMFENPNSTQPFISFKHNGIEYFISSDRLGNITMGEFDYLHFLHKRYIKSKKKEYITKICAVLCRREREANTEEKELDKQIDKRIPFRAALVNKQTDLFKDLPLSTQYIVMHYYIGSLVEMNKKYELFSESEEKVQGLPGPNFFKKKEEDWQTIMFDLADGDMQKYKDYFNTPAHTFLNMLNRLNAKYAALNSKTK